jgi:hypothetical protein
MQAILAKPGAATAYLFANAPAWIESTHKRYAEKPVLAVGAASSVGAATYGMCATIALLLQLPCSLAAAYLDRKKTE